MIAKLEGKRKKGKPRMRCMDGVEKDLRNLCVVNWRAKAQEGWLEKIFVKCTFNICT
jgi:hypothetical protein